jgi:hypothetical protein
LLPPTQNSKAFLSSEERAASQRTVAPYEEKEFFDCAGFGRSAQNDIRNSNFSSHRFRSTLQAAKPSF